MESESVDMLESNKELNKEKAVVLYKKNWHAQFSKVVFQLSAIYEDYFSKITK